MDDETDIQYRISLMTQRFQKLTVKLMQYPQFALYSGVFLIGKTSVVHDLPKLYKEMFGKEPSCSDVPAVTNGRDVWFDLEYYENLEDAMLAFDIMHETFHKVFLHCTGYRHLQRINATAYQIAVDQISNTEIFKSNIDDDMGNKMFLDNPARPAIYYPELAGLDTTTVFKIFKDIVDPPSNGTPQYKDAQGQPIDMEALADKVKDSQPKDEHVPSKDKGSGNDSESEDKDGQGNGSMSLSQEEAQETQQQINQALREGSQMMGKNNPSGSKLVKDLLDGTLPWEQILADEVKEVMVGQDDETWRKFNRNYLPIDIYLPSMYSERIGALVFSCDTSGSISSRERNLMLGECIKISKEVTPERLDVIYWGSRVVGHESYLPDDFDTIPEVTDPKDGGGTHAGVVSEYIHKNYSEKPDVLIVATDGYIERSPMGFEGIANKKLIWLVVNNKSFSIDVPGTVIHVSI